MGGTPDMLHTSLGQTFVSPVPFDRVSLLVGTYVSPTSGFVATLLQDVGGRWARKQVQVFQDVPDNAEVVLHFATQPAGKYLLEITSPSGGGIAWYRSTSDAYPGDGLYALVDGSPVAGDRWFRVYQGAYRLRVPEDHVDAVLEPGQRYVIPR
jgi:hypothetical protein